MDEFYQRKLFLKKKFTFKENGIEIEFKDSDGEFSLFISFDNIGDRENVRVFNRRKKNIIRLGIAFTLLTIFKGITVVKTDERAFIAAMATAAIIGLVFYVYYYFTSLKYYAVPLLSGKHFQVLYSSPSANAADEFLTEIYQRRDAYLRVQYPAEQE